MYISFCVPAVVEYTLLGTTFWGLLLLLLFNLWCLRFHLASTSKRSVNCGSMLVECTGDDRRRTFSHVVDDGELD